MIQDIKLGTEGIENVPEEGRKNAIKLVERTIKLMEKGEKAEKEAKEIIDLIINQGEVDTFNIKIERTKLFHILRYSILKIKEENAR